MAPKKSSGRGKDSLAPGKAAAGRKPRNPVVHVLTEGTLTEPMYIDLVVELATERVRHGDGKEIRPTVLIVNDERTHNGTKGPKEPKKPRKPRDLVDEALRIAREQNRLARRDGLRSEEYPAVWCLFDRDQHEGVDESVDRVRKANATGGVQIRIAFSHPCFEIWRLLHHQSFTSTCGGVCGDASDRLRRVTKLPADADIKLVRADDLRKNYTEARKRAVQMNKQWGEHHKHSVRDPYTDVWEFVEKGLRVLAY